MSLPYAACLVALWGETYAAWGISRLLDPDDNVTVSQLQKLVSKWNLTPQEQRHELRLQLRAEHPAEFARAAERLIGREHGLATRLLSTTYEPELWPEVSAELQFPPQVVGFDWHAELAKADDTFLATLPLPLYDALVEALADRWWWSGEWTSARVEGAARLGDPAICLQMAMLAGDAERVSLYLGKDQKRQGYAMAWDFLSGQPHQAYLALRKLVDRRRADLPVFPAWVALWARLVALSQGDQQLFGDRRLRGNVEVEEALGDLNVQAAPNGPEIVLGRGLAQCGIWIARQYHPNRLRLAPGVAQHWEELGLRLLAEQLQERPAAPLLPLANREEPWRTFLRLLETQSQAASPKPASSGSKGPVGALLWHLFPPEVVFYNNKTASPELGPEKLDGKPVGSKALLSRMPNYLTDQDLAALAKVRLSSYGSALVTAEVLRALVGHPRVYQKWRRTELKEQPQRLRLERRDGSLRLSLWPEIPRERDYLLDEDGRFFTRSPLEKLLGPLLYEHAPVPLSAESELRAVLAKWADRIEVEVGQGLEGIKQTRLQADLLILRARPVGRGMRFDWLVSCSELPDYQRPALEGREQERITQPDGVAVVVRDLAREQQVVERYLSLCPSLPPGGSFRLDSLAEVLELLQECREAGVTLEWPEGQAWRVRRASSLNVAAARVAGEEWFALEGGLALEQGETLDLQQALAAARLAQGSYLKLGENDFVRLDAELREQLEALADISDTDQPRIPALAVPSLAELELAGLSCDQAFEERLASFRECADFVAPIPRRLEAELRDYQVEGYRWLARHARMGTGACLADDMGLGKTLQTIALMLHLRSEGPHLVVCPLSVLAQWAQQIEQFAPTLRVRRERELKGLKAGDVVLRSYGVLLRDSKALSKLRWSVVVLDEAQAIKNPQSKTARAAFQLQGRVRVTTTGTPIENRMSELWSLFAFLNPGLLGTLAAFRRRYEEPGAGRSRLRRLIAPFVLRRLKSQVLTELPARTEVTLKVPLGDEERALYESLRLEAQRELEEGQSLELLAHLTRLRQACCHPRLLLPSSELSSSKLETLMELLERLGEGHHRALVFSQFTRFLDLVEEQLRAREIVYQRLDGSTAVRERERRVAAFQEGEGDVFLISLKAGGTGLNLTGADYVIHLDPWWNPAAEDQASDRAHRIGQRRPVTIYKLVAEDTLEEKVVRLHGHKRELAQSVLEGSDQTTALSLEELRELVRMA
jgi:superfamily II DNA or RNA helicase